jgi:tRNA nucleotidyltransferase (CCA-adding enzyme)
MVPTVLDRLTGLTQGPRLLDAVDGLEGLHLVGGAVRDLALDRTPRELDLVAEHDGPGVARELARRLGGELRVHDTFGTATVTAPDLSLDVATARAESYPAPGALPVVRGGSLEEDMARRDFTVNAIAVGVSPDVRGAVHAFPGAVEDLQAGRLRVLHDRSFVDDPTRLMRLARYGIRLGLVLDPRTEQLARAAFADDTPATAGVARMARELWLLLSEPDPVRGLLLLADLAGDEMGDHPRPIPLPGMQLGVEPSVVDDTRRLLPDDAAHEHALLATIVAERDPAALRAWLDAAHVTRPEIVLDAARDPAALAQAMWAAKRPSELAAAVRGRSVEAVAVAGACGPKDEARRWLEELRHVKLDITGADLLAAGVRQGPEIGRRLGAALAKKLDGEIATRDEELAAAMSSL